MKSADSDLKSPPSAAPAKILFTLPNFDTAGSGRALFEVVRRLDRRFFKPSICVARRGGKLEAEVEAAGIPLFEAPFTVAARPLLGLKSRIQRAASRFEQDFAIWHSMHYLDDYTEPLIARSAGARFVFTKKNMSWNRRSWFLRALFSRRIGAQNRDMLQRFFAHWPLAGKTVYLPRGVDTLRFAPVAKSEDEKAGGRLRLGCVAHLLPVKGQDRLIEAIAAQQEIELHLAGRPLDADYVAQLEKRIDELGLSRRVILHGDVTDVPAFLHGLDVFVLATRAVGRMEGCPVALLEAMATGLPVLAPDIPGVRDLLATAGSGLLLPADDPHFLSALGHSLESLRLDSALRQQLGAAARRRVLQEFAIESEVSRHERLYREMLHW